MRLFLVRAMQQLLRCFGFRIGKPYFVPMTSYSLWFHLLEVEITFPSVDVYFWATSWFWDSGSFPILPSYRFLHAHSSICTESFKLSYPVTWWVRLSIDLLRLLSCNECTAFHLSPDYSFWDVQSNARCTAVLLFTSRCPYISVRSCYPFFKIPQIFPKNLSLFALFSNYRLFWVRTIRPVV